MAWLKDNWFKLSLLVIITLFGFFLLKYLGEITSVSHEPNDFRQHYDKEQKAAAQEKAVILLGTETNIKTEPPFDWSAPDAILPTMIDTMNTYRQSHSAIQTTINTEFGVQNQIYTLLEKTNDPSTRQLLLQLLDYDKQYTNSGIALLNWLDTTATYYERLIAAIRTRDKSQYLMNSSLIDQQEAKKEVLISDFSAKERIKQNFAANGITP